MKTFLTLTAMAFAAVGSAAGFIGFICLCVYSDYGTHGRDALYFLTIALITFPISFLIADMGRK